MDIKEKKTFTIIRIEIDISLFQSFFKNCSNIKNWLVICKMFICCSCKETYFNMFLNLFKKKIIVGSNVISLTSNFSLPVSTAKSSDYWDGSIGPKIYFFALLLYWQKLKIIKISI